MALAGGYRNALQVLAEEFGLESEITPQVLAGYPDVLIQRAER